MGRSNRYYGKRAAEENLKYAKTTSDTKDVQKVKSYYDKRAAKNTKPKNSKLGKKPQNSVWLRMPY